MLNCWKVDTKRRLCFSEIVAELSKLIDFDDGYFALKTASLDDPTMPPHNADDDYVNPTSDDNRTPNDDYVNA